MKRFLETAVSRAAVSNVASVSREVNILRAPNVPGVISNATTIPRATTNASRAVSIPNVASVTRDTIVPRAPSVPHAVNVSAATTVPGAAAVPSAGNVLGGATVPRAAIWPLSDYVKLTKPRSILPHFVTASAAMFLAAGSVPRVSTILLTLLGGGCAAAAANTFNCILDRDIDALMSRTRGRPLPSGMIKPSHALVFATVMGLLGIFILGDLVSRVAAIFAATALVYYVLAYTLWLRRRTYWSAIVCSPIGAIPPIIGWVVVTNRITPTPFLLSAIVILWTIPHFWALALFRRDDYAKAGSEFYPRKEELLG